MNIRSEIFKTALQCLSEICDETKGTIETEDGHGELSEFDNALVAAIEARNAYVEEFENNSDLGELVWKERETEESETA